MKKITLFLILILALLLWDSCYDDFYLGSDFNFKEEIVSIPLVVYDAAGCDAILSLSGTLCFSRPEVIEVLNVSTPENSKWNLHYDLETNAFTLTAIDQDLGVPVNAWDVLLEVDLRLKGETSDFSIVSVCNQSLRKELICLENGVQKTTSAFSVGTGRLEVIDSIFIAGRVRTIDSAQVGVPDVKVLLENDYFDYGFTAQTDAAGDYDLGKIFTGYYSFDLSCSELSGKPLSTLGMIRMILHIYGVQPLPPLYVLAADVDCDEDLDMDDVLLYQSAILSQQGAFENCPLWKFVREDIVFANPENPFPEAGDQSIAIFDNNPHLNFIAIETGRFPDSIDVPSTEVPLALRAQIYNQKEESGIRFHLSENQTLSGLQLSLRFDPKALEHIEIVSELLDESTFKSATQEDGLLLIHWVDPEGKGKKLYAGVPLFELKFPDADFHNRQTLLFQLDENRFPAKAYDVRLKAFRIVLEEPDI